MGHDVIGNNQRLGDVMRPDMKRSRKFSSNSMYWSVLFFSYHSSLSVEQAWKMNY